MTCNGIATFIAGDELFWARLGTVKWWRCGLSLCRVITWAGEPPSLLTDALVQCRRHLPGWRCTALRALHSYWNSEGVVIAHNRQCIDWLFVQSVDDSQARITSLPRNSDTDIITIIAHEWRLTADGFQNWRLLSSRPTPSFVVCAVTRLSVHAHTHQSINRINHPVIVPTDLRSIHLSVYPIRYT
jgi:hypothetical protein